MPFLSRISLSRLQDDNYLQQIRSLNKGLDLSLKRNVTFFVDENGSGKSTLLEGVAEHCGFNLRGGNRNHNFSTGYQFEGYESPLTHHLHLTWTPRRISEGFFVRAESFFNFASYIDELAVDDARIFQAYGGHSLHMQSHGESFLALFNNQFESGIYLLDEPEAALSPARILTFMSVINRLERSGRAQFLIATHSPILICYPGAAIYQHFHLKKSFLNNPALYLRHLMAD